MVFALNSYGKNIYLNYSLKQCSSSRYYLKLVDCTDSSGFQSYSGEDYAGKKIKFITRDLESRTGTLLVFDKKGDLDHEGDFLNGLNHGKWKYYYRSGKVSAIITRDSGVVKGVTYFDKEGIECCSGENRLKVDPKFQGANFEAFTKYLEGKLNDNADVDYNGNVTITFRITKNGDVVGPFVNTQLPASIKQSIIEIVEDSPSFEPFILYNRPVEKVFQVTVKILNDGSKVGVAHNSGDFSG